MMQKIATIREAECIGCIKCIKACSDDAILGARKQLHTILTDLCTGCEECVSVCPVDCIEMIEKPATLQNLTADLAQKTTLAIHKPLEENLDDQSKQDVIAQAMARTLARRGWKPS